MAMDGLDHQTRRFDADFDAFLELHSTWFSKFIGSEPIYSLPTVVIETLGRREISRRTEPFLTKEEVIAEHAFNRLCEAHSAVGIWNQTRISCELLKPSPSPFSSASTSIPWLNNANSAEIYSLCDRLSHTRERLKGIAGWLMTDQGFLTQLAALRTRYEAADEGSRPLFPLQRANLGHGHNANSKTAVQFHSTFQEFCNRFGLSQLITWDIPEPQGPFFSDPLPATSPARPERGLYLFIPLSYPVTGNDDLLSMISARQQEMARSLAVDERLGRMTSHVIFAKAFEIEFLEKAIRSRFQEEPHGLVGAIQEAVSGELNNDESYIKQLRTEIAARKVGRTKKLKLLK